MDRLIGMKKAVFVTFLIAAAFCFSTRAAGYTYNTDFPAFYRTAQIITDPNTPNTTVYDRNLTAERYDNNWFIEYRYSMLVAYLMAPFAYLSYDTAKVVMIFIILLSYTVASAIVLHYHGATGRWFYYPLLLSFFWAPFIFDLRLLQVDAIILLLIVLGSLAANKKHPLLGGVLLGLASLFKVFPVAIALVFGLRNWRVPLGYALIFLLALLIPGSKNWFYSFLYQPFGAFQYSPLLNYMGYGGFIVVTCFIAVITAVMALRSGSDDYFLLASFATPAMLLAAPIMEWSHFTILIIPYLYIITSHKAVPKSTILMALLSVVLILIGGPEYYLLTSRILFFCGLLCLWVGMGLFLLVLKSTEQIYTLSPCKK